MQNSRAPFSVGNASPLWYGTQKDIWKRAYEKRFMSPGPLERFPMPLPPAVLPVRICRRSPGMFVSHSLL